MRKLLGNPENKTLPRPDTSCNQLSQSERIEGCQTLQIQYDPLQPMTPDAPLNFPSDLLDGILSRTPFQIEDTDTADLTHADFEFTHDFKSPFDLRWNVLKCFSSHASKILFALVSGS